LILRGREKLQLYDRPVVRTIQEKNLCFPKTPPVLIKSSCHPILEQRNDLAMLLGRELLATVHLNPPGNIVGIPLLAVYIRKIRLLKHLIRLPIIENVRVNPLILRFQSLSQGPSGGIGQGFGKGFTLSGMGSGSFPFVHLSQSLGGSFSSMSSASTIEMIRPTGPKNFPMLGVSFRRHFFTNDGGFVMKPPVA
jgi:hypothetical protein